MPGLEQHPKRTTPPASCAEPTGEKPAWSSSELEGLHDNADKQEKVRAMFTAIARSYDLNNRLHSMWRDTAWRRRAVREGGVRPGERVLDVACGTGDLSQDFARRSQAESVTGLDYTQAMLDIAEHKRANLHPEVRDRIVYLQGDAQRLPFDDASFDVVSIAFGIRNVQDPERALGEFFRVLKPGGRVVVLEFGQPSFGPMRWFNRFYCGTIMPRTATWIARDRSGAYRYLPKSVASFYSRDEMEAKLRAAGFSGVRSVPLTFGICNCSVGTR